MRKFLLNSFSKTNRLYDFNQQKFLRFDFRPHGFRNNETQLKKGSLPPCIYFIILDELFETYLSARNHRRAFQLLTCCRAYFEHKTNMLFSFSSNDFIVRIKETSTIFFFLEDIVREYFKEFEYDRKDEMNCPVLVYEAQLPCEIQGKKLPQHFTDYYVEEWEADELAQYYRMFTPSHCVKLHQKPRRFTYAYFEHGHDSGGFMHCKNIALPLINIVFTDEEGYLFTHKELESKSMSTFIRILKQGFGPDCKILIGHKRRYGNDFSNWLTPL